MKRFIALLLVFASLCSLLGTSVSASYAPGYETYFYAASLSLSSTNDARSSQRRFEVQPQEDFDLYLQQCLAINLSCSAAAGVSPFSPVTINFSHNGSMSPIIGPFTTIAFHPGTYYFSGPGNTVVVGGLEFLSGQSYGISPLFYSVFPKGMNYNGNSVGTGSSTTWYLPSDADNKCLVWDFSSDASSELFTDIEELSQKLSIIGNYNSSFSTSLSYSLSELVYQSESLDNLHSDLSSISYSLDALLSEVEDLSLSAANIETNVYSILSRLITYLPSYQTSFDTMNDFLYSCSSDIYNIRQQLYVINGNILEQNEILGDIRDDLAAESLKSVSAGSGQSLFSLFKGFIGKIFGFFISLFRGVSGIFDSVGGATFK